MRKTPRQLRSDKIDYKSNKGAYRHVENPSLYGEKSMRGTLAGCFHIVRKPKKCRKTAWKRFYKIFPYHDPKNQNKPYKLPPPYEASKILNK